MEQLFRGNVITMEKEGGPADGIWVSQGVIRQVGDFETLRREHPEAAVEDYAGKTILPGFVDGHSHLSAVAFGLLLFNAAPSPQGCCDTVEDLVREGKKYLAEAGLAPGQWLLGLGYDNAVMPGECHPTRQDLDRISREIPVAITHVSGHLCAVNTRAMELLGYLGDHPQVPEGGEVDPQGLLKETAFTHPDKAARMQGPGPEQMLAAVGRASRLYASYGITTVQDGRTTQRDLDLLLGAGKAGILLGDVVCYLDPGAAEKHLPRGGDPRENPYRDRCRMAGIKLYLDGSPQGKTAWLSQPYYRVPAGKEADYRGFPVQREEDVREFFLECIRNRWQPNVHANGDAAIQQMIDCWRYALEKAGTGRDLRPVVIHCQTASREQLHEMARLGMLASFFHDHVYYWGDYHYESVLGPERASRISPLRWAEEEGVPFSLHQDSPVVRPDVMLAVQNAVCRRTRGGRVLGAEQRIGVMEALWACTGAGAWQIFEENRKGTIAPGKLADFAVLGSDPRSVDPEAIREIPILATIKEGHSIWVR